MLLTKALEYHNLGLNIIPLANHEKNPSKLMDWKLYQSQRLTEDEVRTWFSQDRVTGIGLICGRISGLIVVDDDNYKTGKPLPLTSPMEVKTASGGRHIYYKFNNEANQNIKTPDHIFEVQGEGKLVLLPPSKAMNKMGHIGEYTWLKTGNFSELPNLPDLSAYAPKKEHNEFLELDHGIQHNQMVKLMNKWLFSSPESEWDTLVWNQIKTAANNYRPAYDERLLHKDWEDCKRYVTGKRMAASKPKNIEEISRERVEERELEKIAPSTGFVVLDKLIKGFVPGHLYAVSGLTNVGKTSVSANFAYNAYSQGKRVLYFSFEPGNTLMDYLASIIFKKEYQNVTNEDIIETAKRLNNLQIRTREQVKTVQDIIKIIHGEERFDLIIIDHLGYFITGSTSGGTNQEQSNTVKQLAMIAKQYRSAIIQIVHTNKQAGDIPTLLNISGSKSITDDSTEVIFVTRDKKPGNDPQNVEYLDTGMMIVAKTKCGPNGAIKINFMPRSAYITDKSIQNTWQAPF